MGENLSIKKAFPKITNGCPPTILVPIEEWDETTDAIIWLYQQKYQQNLNLHSITFTLDEMPTARETLQEQCAEIKGLNSKNLERVFLMFDAVLTEVDDENVYGYKIQVRTLNPVTFRYEKEKEYTIKGENREEFEIIKEQSLK